MGNRVRRWPISCRGVQTKGCVDDLSASARDTTVHRDSPRVSSCRGARRIPFQIVMWRQENGKEALGILREERRGSANTTSPQDRHETAVGCVPCALTTAGVRHGGGAFRPAG